MWERQKFTGGPWEPVSCRQVPARVYRLVSRLMGAGYGSWNVAMPSEHYYYRFLWAV